MTAPVPSRLNPHLRAAAYALGSLALMLLVSMPIFAWAAQRRLLELIETPLPMKNQGEWLQRKAFEQKDMLPVYGSSEMAVVTRARPDEFFHSMPTGFRVCPVGAPGSTSFLIAQKLAAIGDVIRGKKIAVILSGTWFCRAGVPDDSYEGNFSPLQAGSIMLHGELDTDLQNRFVSRMLDFPGSLAPHPPLGPYLRLSGEEGRWPAAMRALANPLLWASRAELTWEDRFATSIAAVNLEHVKPPHAGTRNSGADFARLISEIERAERPEPERDLRSSGGRDDATFVEEMNASKEWDDLELLLDTLMHFKMHVVVLSVPLPGRYYDQREISRDARDHFYGRLESLCAGRGMPCFDFSDHERDECFTLPHSSHFSEKGWLYVDRVLDDFYHDRLSAPGPAGKAH